MGKCAVKMGGGGVQKQDNIDFVCLVACLVPVQYFDYKNDQVLHMEVSINLTPGVLSFHTKKVLCEHYNFIIELWATILYHTLLVVHFWGLTTIPYVISSSDSRGLVCPEAFKMSSES